MMEEEINLFDYWRILVKWKKTIYAIVVTVTIASAVVSLFLPKIYQAEASLMPIGGQKSGGLFAMAASQMGLGGLLANVGGSSAYSPQFLVFLNSRTLAERMIRKYELIPFLFKNPKEQPAMEDAVKALRSVVAFRDDKKSQLVKINVQVKDPHMAAMIANGYINELSAYINENTFTSAKRNRIFIEGQLERNKAELLESGKEISTFYEVNKISNVVPSVDVDVAIAPAGGSKALKVESSGPNAGKRDENKEGGLNSLSFDVLNSTFPGVSTAWADIQKKTDELQVKVDEIGATLEKVKIVKGVPQQVYLEYLTLRHGLLNQVNGLLTQQYEMAKIDEAKEDLNFQVVDWAQVPVKRFKPQRTSIVITSFVLSLFLAIFYALFREYLGDLNKQRGKSPS
jgi:uncharacterized protein involved in exopolysaccharide biosynthesis